MSDPKDTNDDPELAHIKAHPTYKFWHGLLQGMSDAVLVVAAGLLVVYVVVTILKAM